MQHWDQGQRRSLAWITLSEANSSVQRPALGCENGRGDAVRTLPSPCQASSLLLGQWPGPCPCPSPSLLFPPTPGHHDITTTPSTSALSTEANLMCLASSGQKAWNPVLPPGLLAAPRLFLLPLEWAALSWPETCPAHSSCRTHQSSGRDSSGGNSLALLTTRFTSVCGGQ